MTPLPHLTTAVLGERAGLPVLHWPALDALGLQAVVTTRHGGVSSGAYASLNLGLHVGDDPVSVCTNRERAAAAVGLELDDLAFCNQAHGREVITVSAASRGRGARVLDDAIEQADALVTSEPGIGLVVMVADCVPIVLIDPERRVLGVVHSGWRGTVAKVAAAAVTAMAAIGAHPESTLAAIGPAIAPERYEVGDDVVSAAYDAFGDDAGMVITDLPNGRHCFDLWSANRLVLAEAGVSADNILSGEEPTGAGTPYFSDRTQRPCGRFAAIARL
jgi:polyphenol oxidase